MFDYSGVFEKMELHNMKKCDLTRDFNIHQKTIDRMSRGDGISMRSLAILCDVFNCEIEDLVKYKKDK